MIKLKFVEPGFRIPRSSEVILVGSSGVLLDHNMGSFIDSHDIVVRFNGSLTENFESHVGSRISMRILSWREYDFRNFTENKYSYPILVHALKRKKLRFRDRRKNAENEVFLIKWHAILRGSIRFIEKKYGIKYKVPSTGFIAIMQFILSGILPTCIGFGNFDKHHYFNGIPLQKNCIHNFKVERILLDKLCASNLIRFIDLES